MPIKKPKYPKPGDVLWEGGFADEATTLPAAVPQRYLGGLTLLYVIVDTTQEGWQDLATAVWEKEGTVCFAEEERPLVEELANRLVAEGRLHSIYPDDNQQIGLPGIRAHR